MFYFLNQKNIFICTLSLIGLMVMLSPQCLQAYSFKDTLAVPSVYTKSIVEKRIPFDTSAKKLPVLTMGNKLVFIDRYDQGLEIVVWDILSATIQSTPWRFGSTDHFSLDPQAPQGLSPLSDPLSFSIIPSDQFYLKVLPQDPQKKGYQGTLTMTFSEAEEDLYSSADAHKSYLQTLREFAELKKLISNLESVGRKLSRDEYLSYLRRAGRLKRKIDNFYETLGKPDQWSTVLDLNFQLLANMLRNNHALLQNERMRIDYAEALGKALKPLQDSENLKDMIWPVGTRKSFEGMNWQATSAVPAARAIIPDVHGSFQAMIVTLAARGATVDPNKPIVWFEVDSQGQLQEVDPPSDLRASELNQAYIPVPNLILPEGVQVTFLGDFFDRGPNGDIAFVLAVDLAQRHPGQVEILLGNHEVGPLFSGLEDWDALSNYDGFQLKNMQRLLSREVIEGRIKLAASYGTLLMIHAPLVKEFLDDLIGYYPHLREFFTKIKNGNPEASADEIQAFVQFLNQLLVQDVRKFNEPQGSNESDQEYQERREEIVDYWTSPQNPTQARPGSDPKNPLTPVLVDSLVGHMPSDKHGLQVLEGTQGRVVRADIGMTSQTHRLDGHFVAYPIDLEGSELFINQSGIMNNNVNKWMGAKPGKQGRKSETQARATTGEAPVRTLDIKPDVGQTPQRLGVLPIVVPETPEGGDPEHENSPRTPRDQPIVTSPAGSPSRGAKETAQYPVGIGLELSVFEWTSTANDEFTSRVLVFDLAANEGLPDDHEGYDERVYVFEKPWDTGESWTFLGGFDPLELLAGSLDESRDDLGNHYDKEGPMSQFKNLIKAPDDFELRYDTNNGNFIWETQDYKNTSLKKLSLPDNPLHRHVLDRLRGYNPDSQSFDQDPVIGNEYSHDHAWGTMWNALLNQKKKKKKSVSFKDPEFVPAQGATSDLLLGADELGATEPQEFGAQVDETEEAHQGSILNSLFTREEQEDINRRASDSVGEGESVVIEPRTLGDALADAGKQTQKILPAESPLDPYGNNDYKDWRALREPDLARTNSLYKPIMGSTRNIAAFSQSQKSFSRNSVNANGLHSPQRSKVVVPAGRDRSRKDSRMETTSRNTGGSDAISRRLEELAKPRAVRSKQQTGLRKTAALRAATPRPRPSTALRATAPRPRPSTAASAASRTSISRGSTVSRQSMGAATKPKVLPVETEWANVFRDLQGFVQQDFPAEELSGAFSINWKKDQGLAGLLTSLMRLGIIELNLENPVRYVTFDKDLRAQSTLRDVTNPREHAKSNVFAIPNVSLKKGAGFATQVQIKQNQGDVMPSSVVVFLIDLLERQGKFPKNYRLFWNPIDPQSLRGGGSVKFVKPALLEWRRHFNDRVKRKLSSQRLQFEPLDPPHEDMTPLLQDWSKVLGGQQELRTSA